MILAHINRIKTSLAECGDGNTAQMLNCGTRRVIWWGSG